MVAVLPPSIVLVTGASGFIAAHLCKLLLEKGYKVRGTVRSEEKGQYLHSLLSSPNFTYLIVPDIEAAGAFDQAVQGVDAVQHTASPFHGRAVDPQELIGPAVQGTKGLLESVQKFNPAIKRIVITSSVASILVPCKPGTTFTEQDWNTYSPGCVAREGINAPNMEKYRASKVLAERAAWEFVQKENPGWDLVTVCPPMVFGPIIHQVNRVESINTSIAALHSAFTPSGAKTGAAAGSSAGSWVDVRDVAQVHLEALAQEKAGGQRYIASGGPFSWQMVYDSAQSVNVPDGGGLDLEALNKGTPGSDRETKYNVFSSEKAQRELGVSFRPLGECVRDTLVSLKGYGFH
ncbi:D-lactaldehyde dehydrogenase [Dacryopinax primogenitus]|uniref:D-lactaldehyde dehydrogenase n=1 Tax=Dacryopinax primogenitus (strain DJM 731) TaxID=1858805 RepID=M5G1D3_DACPD|nr:D-lactaldehyde dehydrogenase [Dacryopinax primogenitus]EJT99636.1 D-lactaldehyde dehydrogenase [Dacryopinax primogenitus]